jgi:homoisocitrate dehydrogenase
VISAATELLVLEPGLTIDVQNAGRQTWEHSGEAITAEVLHAAQTADGVLFGATATPSPRPPGYRSPILELRRALGAFANLRYCRGDGVGAIDVVIVRESAEGLYSGHERRISGGAVADYRVTEQASLATARAAARVARDRRGEVTIVHKANVLPQTDGLFRATAITCLEQESIEWNEILADTAGYELVRNPARFDVMLTGNHVGDMLSDVAAAVAGGLGRIPSLTLGDGPPLAEPVHGSAPDIAGTGTADPVAAILSAALLLCEIGRPAFAARLTTATREHLFERTPDAVVRTDAIAADIRRRLG